MIQIDWHTLSRALIFYQNYGYTYMETPWMIDAEVITWTCPNKNNIFDTKNNMGLVGSAEQSFISLVNDGVITPSSINYMSMGPCFRNEPIDELHQHQFVKLELFASCNTEVEAKEKSEEFLKDASEFFFNAEVVDSEAGKDLEIAGIEVGSYGFRHHPRVGWWAFGTGIAEPRYTQAMRKFNEQRNINNAVDPGS